MLNHREQLQAIRTFPQLVKYLRDELDWPISQDDFEDLTFEYSPEELGIDIKVAAKIQEIRRLRPLSVHQPWGIFFVKFEPKRLPVVAMRRMLNAVAIKNRASAANADKITWASDDLLFISNYGDEENRQITFAHFTQDPIKKDLPTLKVLGWDNRDTALHLDYVSENLSTYLSWPADEKDVVAWRNSWRSAFSVAHREVIDTAKKLSIHLAHLARNIRDRINTVLEYETENGPISKLKDAFKEALVHDLDNDGFADMYAQTIAYGLLSARISNPSGKTADDFASAMLVTNPFLKELMETFVDVGGRGSKKANSIRLDFDELGVSEVVELLDAANMEAVVRDFGDKNPLEDPVTHFYEQFFADYDNSERFKRGVFYTPRPVVSFIVRSVDEILRTEFSLEYGLADTTTWGVMAGRIDGLKIPEGATSDQAFVQILDPATGTGTFLVEVIDLIHKTMQEKWQVEGHGATMIQQLWNDYVPTHLLPRLHGYELMMAPYAIAHMKIGLKLYETGYRFESDERARVYLTNALDPVQDFSGTLIFAIPALAHEAEAVNAIKQNQRFTVILGNPPYSVMSGNLSMDARKTIDRYRFVDGLPIKERSMLRLEMHLQDDYVKFLAVSQSIIHKSMIGVTGLITNNGYLDNLTLRGVRNSLYMDFDHIQIFNLHGNRLRANRNRNRTDENVFEIEQGVAIVVMTSGVSLDDHKVEYFEIYGSRSEKYSSLLKSMIQDFEATHLLPKPDNYFFIPRDTSLEEEYLNFTLITEIMPVNISGIVTAHDHLVVDFDADVLLSKANLLRDNSIDDNEVRETLGVKDNAGWKLPNARQKLLDTDDDEAILKPYAYRPFDVRTIYYHTALVWSDRRRIMRHVLSGETIALATCRQLASGPWDHVFISSFLQDDCFISNRTRERSYHFPLMLVDDNDPELRQEQLSFSKSNTHANLSMDYVVRLNEVLGSEEVGIEALEVFSLIYAVLHCRDYRIRYEQFLCTDFPRIPVPRTKTLLKELMGYGESLIDIHLLDRVELGSHKVGTHNTSEFKVEKVTYSDNTVWLDKEQTYGFHDVGEDVWNFHVGCYQVCEKWLKDRQAKGGKNPNPGRVLTDEDIEHYQKIVVAISETIRIMGEIDEVIEAHGGWPGAFRG